MGLRPRDLAHQAGQRELPARRAAARHDGSPPRPVPRLRALRFSARASLVTTRERPIGVFDSGVGGVSVLREIRRALPAEDLIYLADSEYTPYGDRPSTVIIERSLAMVGFLERQGVKAVVVACNTATGIAVDTLRATFA